MFIYITPSKDVLIFFAKILWGMLSLGKAPFIKGATTYISRCMPNRNPYAQRQTKLMAFHLFMLRKTYQLNYIVTKSLLKNQRIFHLELESKSLSW